MSELHHHEHETEESTMETVGWIATVVVALLTLVGIVVLIREIPGIRRYLRIKQM